MNDIQKPKGHSGTIMPEHKIGDDITVTVMTKEKLREFVREEVRKALAEAGIEPGVDVYKTVTKRIEHDWRMSTGVVES